MASLKDLTMNFIKLERFEGGNFLRWQKKIKNLSHFFKGGVCPHYSQASRNRKGGTIAEIRERQKLKNDDDICIGHIFLRLSDRHFDVYQNSISTKKLGGKTKVVRPPPEH